MTKNNLITLNKIDFLVKNGNLLHRCKILGCKTFESGCVYTQVGLRPLHQGFYFHATYIKFIKPGEKENTFRCMWCMEDIPDILAFTFELNDIYRNKPLGLYNYSCSKCEGWE